MTDTAAAPGVLPTRIPGNHHPNRRDRLVIVTDPDIGLVTVRWELGRTPLWRCRSCGPRDDADCIHTFAAAVRLAEDLLGLKSIIEIPEGAES
jgi:hypothetical protein